MAEPQPYQLVIRGPPGLHGPGGATWRPERKTLALLTYLALEGEATRLALVRLLWPDTPEGAARNNLVHLLRRLHRLTGAALVDGQETLALSAQIDVDTRVPEGPGQLPPGPLLQGVEFDELPDFAEWLLAWQERLEARELRALAQQAAAAEQRGDWPAALSAAALLLERDPLSEEHWRRAIRLHYLAGDRPAALSTYHRCRDLLRRELGCDPEPETVALARRIDQGERLPGPPPRGPRELPLSMLRPPVLIGREAAWAQLEAAWAAGQTVYITGAPGVGKTRLAQDFVASKGRALYLPGHPGAEQVPYAAAAHNARARLAAAPDVTLPEWVRREISRVLPELRAGEAAQPIHSEADRLNYFLAHLEVVRLTGQGVAAVISDDVQHYDPATVELGAFFLTQSLPLGQRGDVPRHIILYRQGALPPLTQQRIDALVQAGAAVRIDLDGLDGHSVSALLDELKVTGPSPALARDLHEWTGGNPQHLLEAVRHMHQSGEYSVDAALRERARTVTPLVAERLARLSPRALQGARGAAVLGDAFTLERLSDVLRLGLLDLTAAWEELEAAQVVTGERFSHDTVREAVLASLPAPVRSLLHRASARVLSGAPVHPARVARHWAEAGEAAQAAPWFMRAAEDALQTLRPEEAGAYCDEAAAAYRASGDAEGERRALEARAGLGTPPR
ncbi:BTAD domain-containing putative transcriptional regulator [Deinococcus ficus]|uniref:Bacterial transcriptional activator domain-containing protein n=1 Tax=Deinococcus ficus TaxID=317577 RepID=A0A221T0S8_9DEIO|nr:BTAD domain-containing putative transcriptional regulator [Deinococcus ficus]ASN82508.1 hypothetical protein DFI_15105 [Deinococcus ficus]